MYAAEQQVTSAISRPGHQIDFFGSQLTPPPERHFSTLDDVRSYVQEVVSDHRVTTKWGFLPPLRVRSRAGDAMAHYEYESATIAMPLRSDWAMRELVVLHEIAHHIAASTEPSAPPHGQLFASLYVQLVSWFIGPEVALLLTAAFDSCGVDVNTATVL